VRDNFIELSDGREQEVPRRRRGWSQRVRIDTAPDLHVSSPTRPWTRTCGLPPRRYGRFLHRRVFGSVSGVATGLYKGLVFNVNGGIKVSGARASRAGEPYWDVKGGAVPRCVSRRCSQGSRRSA
jgi:hypothetical protein